MVAHTFNLCTQTESGRALWVWGQPGEFQVNYIVRSYRRRERRKKRRRKKGKGREGKGKWRRKKGRKKGRKEWRKEERKEGIKKERKKGKPQSLTTDSNFFITFFKEHSPTPENWISPEDNSKEPLNNEITPKDHTWSHGTREAEGNSQRKMSSLGLHCLQIKGESQKHTFSIFQIFIFPLFKM